MTKLLNPEAYWIYHPRWIINGEEIFNILLPKLMSRGNVIQRKMYGRAITLPRQSCAFILNKNLTPDDLKDVIYIGTNIYKLDDTPSIITKIKNAINNDFQMMPDYVLCHVYRDGSDYIDWHSDSEALKTDIISVSLSDSHTSRKFRLRPKEWTKSYQHEIDMHTGDVIIMLGANKDNNMSGCQNNYEHCVTKITGKRGRDTKPRINMTFRMLE